MRLKSNIQKFGMVINAAFIALKTVNILKNY